MSTGDTNDGPLSDRTNLVIVNTAERYQSVLDRVATAARAAGRAPESVRVLAAVKTQSPEAIAALVARHYGATPEQLSFYRFEGIAPVPFKRTYREGINGLALAPEQVDALIAEVRASFRFNSALFDALAA